MRLNWRSASGRGLLYQAAALLVVLVLGWFLASNTAHNMAQRGIQSGFDFLWDPAGFEIGEGLFNFDSTQSYALAFLTGLGNTVRVAVTGIVLATLLGTLLGMGRFSRNLLVRGLCSAYVEVFRNIPLLLQLLMWYLMLAELLPAMDAPITLGPMELSKGGLMWNSEALLNTSPNASFNASADALPIEPLWALSPEFMALTLGLTLYTAAFIAEVVRAGVAAVPRGQTEASATLGLSRLQALRHVLLPQALRIIIPPMTNQYLNLTKNSSLAVAIGYPDVVSIANTALNQTGRAVECIALVMAVYLCTSLLTALLMNAYNQRVALQER
jgi:general L-amino acid transport system permease protein